MSRWNDKHVVVLGGSSGLGLSLAHAWRQRGATVTIIGRDADRLASAERQLSADGGSVAVHAVQADVTEPADVDRLFAGLDRIDVQVHAFGRSARGAIEDAAPDDFQQMLDINFLAVVRCVLAGLEKLKTSQGSIVNMGSLAAKIAPRFLSTYPATKFALAAYSEQLRRELARLQVHVLLVCPGPIRRDDAGNRYAEQTLHLPPSAGQPGGGAKIRALCPVRLSEKIIRSCERRQAELVVPAKARLLFALAQLAPRWGDWAVGKLTTP